MRDGPAGSARCPPCRGRRGRSRTRNRGRTPSATWAGSRSDSSTPGLLAPEQVGDEAHESRFGELVGVVAHGVVDAPDLHDGDDGAGRRAVGHGEVGAHLAVAKLHRDVLRLHGVSRVARGRTASRLVSTMTNCGPGRAKDRPAARRAHRARGCGSPRNRRRRRSSRGPDWRRSWRWPGRDIRAPAESRSRRSCGSPTRSP